MVRKSELQAAHTDMFHSDRGVFDRWIRRNLIVGSIFSCGLLIMALAGADFLIAPSGALANSNKAASAASQIPSAPGVPSPFDLMSRPSPHQLPVQQVNEPF